MQCVGWLIYTMLFCSGMFCAISYLKLLNIDKETVLQILHNNSNMKKSVFEDGTETPHS